MSRRERGAAPGGAIAEPWALPDRWRWERLGDVAEINPRTTLPPGGHVSFVPMAAVQEKTFKIDVSQRRSVADAARNYTRFSSGDVVFAKITPCMENGKVAVVPDTPEHILAGSTEFHVVRSNVLIPQYLAFWLNQDSFRNEAARHMTGTAGQMRVPADYMRLSQIPVPPPDEQERLVKRIDQLSSEIDDGEAALSRARADLKVYRRALLKAAVTGELTADWRAANPARETGAELLARILADRRARWHADPKNKGKVYKHPVPPDLNHLPVLSEGWTWASLDQLTSFITSGSRAWSEYYGQGSAVFVMAQNVRRGYYDSTFRQLVGPPANDPERDRTRIAQSDLLLTIVGANTGDMCCVNFDPQEAYVCQSVALLRPIRSTLSPLIEAFFANDFGRKLQMERLIYGAGRPHLSFDQIRSLAVPLCSMNEMEQVQIELQRVQDTVRPTFNVITEANTSSAHLRQAILAAAFRGDLT